MVLVLLIVSILEENASHLYPQSLIAPPFQVQLEEKNPLFSK
jgi:hypothetical protein